MKRTHCSRAPWALAASLLLLATQTRADVPHTHFDLDLQIDPATNVLAADAEILLPEAYAGQALEFLLTDAVKIVAAEPPVQQLPYDGGRGFTGINGSSVELTESGNAARYRVQLPAGSATLKLSYRGAINFALGDLKEQYTRGFRSTAGIIGPEGIFLAGSSIWYPYFSNELLTFRLRSNVPEGWHLISQGNGQSRNDAGVAQWDSAGAVDEIYLVGGPLIKYREAAGAVSAEVFLHAPDDALAQKYLTATAQYLEMYRNLIGPYPYGKFALVENFWETGYGMPSFTLLGPQIIRFPFILTSSYPHEILHNWWGNSVFVEYETGNWCEGLTAYMADHLMQELRGSGAQYRRDTLKKYRDFVKEGRDFPLTEFRSRHSAATEAVGYGKVLMGFHMLRREIGDEQFRQAMARFYRANRGRKASFADVRSALEQTSGRDLAEFFTQWVTWTGAPELRVAATKVATTADGYTTSGRLEQLQAAAPYALDVPLQVTTADGTDVFTVSVTEREQAFHVQTTSPPLLLEVDPEFDLFRLLDPRETAPSIGQIFGEPEIIAVLPSAASEDELRAWRELVDGWQSGSHDIAVVTDAQMEELPSDRAAWLFGATNRLATRLFASAVAIDVEIGTDSLLIAGTEVGLDDHSTVIVRRHPGNDAKAVGWITVQPEAAFPGLGGKLPHYGKYSYLAFAGDEPANTLKGEWTATDSPLRVDLRAGGRGPAVVAARKPREALAELPPVFSRDRLIHHVEILAGADMAGRGLGTPGLERAAEYIIEQFAAAGLQPGGDDGSWSQVFRVDEGEDGQPHDVRNIVGVLPGTNSAMLGETVLVTAHYDHLGHGWPDDRADAGSGAIYHGADDNASGVSVLIELARNLASKTPPQRTVTFVAFTGEESGLQGSRYFARRLGAQQRSGVIGVVNLDTVGRLGDKDIAVFGAGSASEWQHVFRGIGFTTGIGSSLVTGDFAASDQEAFIELGIPGVHLSSGANFDYHRPSDTVDKIDADGLVKIAVFTKEAVEYLAERPDMLTATIDTEARALSPAPSRESQQGGRRVSVGTVPDFAFQGPGVRVDSVVPGSAAEAAGITAGDVLIGLAGQPVANLQGFTDLLKSLEPGQTVPAEVQRDGERIRMEITLTAR